MVVRRLCFFVQEKRTPDVEIIGDDSLQELLQGESAGESCRTRSRAVCRAPSLTHAVSQCHVRRRHTADNHLLNPILEPARENAHGVLVQTPPPQFGCEPGTADSVKCAAHVQAVHCHGQALLEQEQP